MLTLQLTLRQLNFFSITDGTLMLMHSFKTELLQLAPTFWFHRRPHIFQRPPLLVWWNQRVACFFESVDFLIRPWTLRQLNYILKAFGTASYTFFLESYFNWLKRWDNWTTDIGKKETTCRLLILKYFNWLKLCGLLGNPTFLKEAPTCTMESEGSLFFWLSQLLIQPLNFETIELYPQGFWYCKLYFLVRTIFQLTH